jgi:hypothetical protein
MASASPGLAGVGAITWQLTSSAARTARETGKRGWRAREPETGKPQPFGTKDLDLIFVLLYHKVLTLCRTPRRIARGETGVV